MTTRYKLPGFLGGKGAWLTIVGLLVAACATGALIWVLQGAIPVEVGGDPAPAQPQAQDQDVTEAFKQSVAAETVRDPAWLVQVSSVTVRTDGRMVAKTTIAGTAEDLSPVRDICTRLASFVGLSGREFRGVSVLGAQDRILATREVSGQPCRMQL